MDTAVLGVACDMRDGSSRNCHARRAMIVNAGNDARPCNFKFGQPATTSPPKILLLFPAGS